MNLLPSVLLAKLHIDASLFDVLRHRMTQFLLLLCALVMVLSITYFFINKNSAPFWDMVNVADFLISQGSTAFDWLNVDIFAFRDNEHRPFLPMLIWGVDKDLFGLVGYLPQALIFVSILVIAWLVGQWADDDRARRWLMMLSCTVLLMAPMHYANLTWDKQIHVYLSILLSLLALMSLTQSFANKATAWWYLVGAVLAASAATFSFGYGVVVWPILLLHSVLMRHAWQKLAFLAVAFGLVIALYASTYQVLQHHTDPGASMFQPLLLLKYTLHFLSGPWYQVGLPLWAANLAAAAGVFVVIGASWRLYIGRDELSSGQQFSVLICLFCVAIGLLTALGRVTVNAGDDSRYLVVSALFYSALPGVLTILVARLRSSWVVIWLFSLSTLLASSIGYLHDHRLREHQFMLREGMIAAAMDIKPHYRGLHPATALVNQRIWPWYFNQHKLDDDMLHFNWLGEPLPDRIIIDHQTASDSCVGHVDALLSDAKNSGVFRTLGWARAGQTGDKKVTWILITNQMDHLVGLATTGVLRDDVQKHLHASWFDALTTQSNRAGFEGHVRAQVGDALSYYAYRNGSACLFANSVVE